MPEDRKKKTQRTPAFTVQDEIRRDRRMRGAVKIRRVRSASRRLQTFLLCTVIILLLLLAGAALVTRIQTVAIEGNARYTSEEVFAASGIGAYSSLLFQTSAALQKKISAACPYIESVRIEKRYPSALTVFITEAEAVYAVDFHGTDWLLDGKLRTLAHGTDTVGLIRLELPEVRRIREGEEIVFSAKKDADIVKEILSVLCGDETVRFGRICLADRYRLSAVLADGSAKIVFGDRRDLAQKLRAAKQLAAEALAEASARTLIDVSSLSMPSVLRDYTDAF